MAGPKVAVVYYSSTGNTHRMAEGIAEGAREAGAEVRMRKVQELAPEAAIAQNPEWKAFHDATKDQPVASLDDLEWADAIILDTTGGLWFQGKLTNKVAAGFATAENPHGGQEATILSLYHTFYHWGAIVAAPGYTDPVVSAAGGNPYGASATRGPSDEELAAARHMGKRVATVAGWVLSGRNAVR